MSFQPGIGGYKCFKCIYRFFLFEMMYYFDSGHGQRFIVFVFDTQLTDIILDLRRDILNSLFFSVF